MSATQPLAPAKKLTFKVVLRKVVTFIIVTLIFGWFYGWASPWAFPKEKQSGFFYGMLHGGLMPMALPSLVIGKDVDIYSTNNSGRFYKLGYICGINVCGLLFFGPIFWKPEKKVVVVELERDAGAT